VSTYTIRRGTVSLSFVALFLALALAGCNVIGSTSHVDLSNPKAVAALCGDSAHDVANAFSAVATNLDSSAGVRKDAITTLKEDWKLANPTDAKSVEAARSALQTRVGTACPVSSGTSTSSTTTPSTIPTPTGTGTPTTTCPSEYVQKFDPNRANRFYSDGVKTVKQDLAYLGHDARTLVFRAFGLKLVKTNDPSTYLSPDRSCLSREGQDLYQRVFGGLSSASVDENGQAPANGYNTGMSGGKAVVDASPGVGGDRTAIVYTLRSGDKLYVMHRCGNIVFPSKVVGIPVGPTEHERPPVVKSPPKTTPPPATPRCPTGWSGTYPNCLEPKVASQGAGVRGNAPTGGGHNATSGPGVVKTQTSAPSTPRVNPTPQAPAMTPRPTPTSVGTTPPPPPPPTATGAPSSPSPGTTAPCAPGIPSC